MTNSTRGLDIRRPPAATRRALASATLGLLFSGCRGFPPNPALVGGNVAGAGAGGALNHAGSGGDAAGGDAAGVDGGESGSSGATSSGGNSAGSGGNSAGSGGSDDAGAGGGGAPALECESDSDCADHQACDGVERCESGSCAQGPAVTCEAPRSCREHAESARCELLEPGPWYTFSGAATVSLGAIGLYGVPSRYATSLAPIELSKGAIDGEVQGVWDLRWSNDGRNLLLNVAGLKRALYAVNFDGGFPSQPRAIPDLPRNEGQYSISSFASDVGCALAQERRLLFEICFDGSEPRVTLVGGDVDELVMETAAFCAGAGAVLVSEQLFDLEHPGSPPEPLPDFVPSPDGTRLLRYGRDTGAGTVDHGLAIRDCALGSEESFVALPPAPSGDSRDVQWAPDSRHATVQTGYSSVSELLLVDLDAPSQPILWQTTPADPENFWHGFSPDASYLLVGDGSTFSLVSIATGDSHALALPPGASSVYWMDGPVPLLGIARTYEPTQWSAAWWVAEPLGTPELVYETESDEVSVTISGRAGLALIVTASDSPVISRVDLSAVSAGAHRINLSIPFGPLRIDRLAPDGSGVVLVYSTELGDNLYWLSLLASNEGQVAWLSISDSLTGDFQPWP